MRRGEIAHALAQSVAAGKQFPSALQQQFACGGKAQIMRSLDQQLDPDVHFSLPDRLAEGRLADEKPHCSAGIAAFVREGDEVFQNPERNHSRPPNYK